MAGISGSTQANLGRSHERICSGSTQTNPVLQASTDLPGSIRIYLGSHAPLVHHLSPLRRYDPPSRWMDA